jgi:hypothetical protein
MADPRVVPIELPAAQTAILRSDLHGWLSGIDEDLETDRLPDPGGVTREAPGTEDPHLRHWAVFGARGGRGISSAWFRS